MVIELDVGRIFTESTTNARARSVANLLVNVVLCSQL